MSIHAVVIHQGVAYVWESHIKPPIEKDEGNKVISIDLFVDVEESLRVINSIMGVFNMGVFNLTTRFKGTEDVVSERGNIQRRFVDYEIVFNHEKKCFERRKRAIFVFIKDVTPTKKNGFKNKLYSTKPSKTAHLIDENFASEHPWVLTDMGSEQHKFLYAVSSCHNPAKAIKRLVRSMSLQFDAKGDEINKHAILESQIHEYRFVNGEIQKMSYTIGW